MKPASFKMSESSPEIPVGFVQRTGSQIVTSALAPVLEKILS